MSRNTKLSIVKASVRVTVNVVFATVLFGEISVVLGNYSFTPKPLKVSEDKCQCNYSEIFTQLPHFINTISHDERFSWTFQGKPGERGPEGAIGPPGLPGRHGREGSKGEPGQQGPRGLPGTSQLFHPRYRSLDGSEKGLKGDPGHPGIKGQKGEVGSAFSTVLRDGSYIEVKGEKGDTGKRGRRGVKGEAGVAGFPGKNGLSIQGEKGSKGEPSILPDLELLRGSPGLRGPPGVRGLPGPPGSYRNAGSSSGSRGPIIIPMPGPPGLSIQGEKGSVGEIGPSGFTVVPGASIFKTEYDMKIARSAPGTISYVEDDERLFIRVANGWKEILLGRLMLDRPRQYPAPIMANETGRLFDPTHRHFLNDVEDKPSYRGRRRNKDSKMNPDRMNKKPYIGE